MCRIVQLCFSHPHPHPPPRSYAFPPGVTVNVVQQPWGGWDAGLQGVTQGAVELNTGHSDLLNWITSDLGYTAGVDLWGAPYNWLLSETGLTQVGGWVLLW